MSLTVAALAAIAIGFLTGRWWSVAATAALAAAGVLYASRSAHELGLWVLLAGVVVCAGTAAGVLARRRLRPRRS